MVWLAWGLALLGVPVAYVVLLAGGMRTAPKLDPGDVLVALALPALAAGAAAAAGAVLPVVLAGATALMVGAGYLGQPAMRRRRERLGDRVLDLLPWTQRGRVGPAVGTMALGAVMRMTRRGHGVAVERALGRGVAWRVELPDGEPGTALGEHCLAGSGDLIAVALGGVVHALAVQDGSTVWRAEVAPGPLWLVAREDVPGADAPGFVAVGLAVLCALDADGTVAWRRDLPPAERVAVEDGVATFFAADGAHWRHRLLDGEPTAAPPVP